MTQLTRRRALALIGSTALTLTMRPLRAQSPRPLIVYLTRTGNTRALAEIIAAETGGELFALTPQPPYSRDYEENVAEIAQELTSDTGHPLARLPDLAAYERIYLGWPNWAMQMPPPVQTFLRQADLRGKTLAPFNTHAGFGVGDGFETLQRLAPNSSILPGLSIKGGYEKKGILLAIQGRRREAVAHDVRAWLN